LAGLRIVVVDDVITAGTAIQTVEINRKEGGKLVGVIVAFDRPRENT